MSTKHFCDSCSKEINPIDHIHLIVQANRSHDSHGLYLRPIDACCLVCAADALIHGLEDKGIGAPRRMLSPDDV